MEKLFSLQATGVLDCCLLEILDAQTESGTAQIFHRTYGVRFCGCSAERWVESCRRDLPDHVIRARSVASGRVLSEERLGGLHHRYDRAA
jgi:hypothetical protein